MSETSDLIKEWFLKSLTARAAYAYFTGIPPGTMQLRSVGAREASVADVINALMNVTPGQQALFSQPLARYFVSHFATLDHQANTASGYSATLFALRSEAIPMEGLDLQTYTPGGAQQQYSQFVFAQRGTETSGFDTVRTDLLDADRNIALTGSPDKQRLDMNLYWSQLIGGVSASPLADLPDVLGNLRTNGVVATGHSLGGALTSWFFLDHKPDGAIRDGLTFNGAGLGAKIGLPGTQLVAVPTAVGAFLYELFGGASSIPAPGMQNIIGEEGPQVTSGVDTVLGPTYQVTIEDTPDGLVGSGWHAMSNLTGSLSCYYLLSQFDNDISLDSIRSIMRSFTADKPNVYETFASWLNKVFQTSGDTTGDGQAEIVDRISWLENLQNEGTPPTFSIVALSKLSADQIFELANGNNEAAAAVRFALVTGEPLAITGSTLNWSIRDNGAYARENFTDEYLRERSLFLEHLNAAYSTDQVELPNHENVSLLGGSYYAEEVDGTEITRRVESQPTGIGSSNMPLHIFGGNNDDTLVGGSKNDYLSGGGGADQLSGGAGNDVLDGGAGNDTLSGEGGVNTLIGGTGYDTYNVALGAETTYIRDADGLGLIRVQDENGWHTLGEELKGVNGESSMAIDSPLNTYRLSGNASAGGSGDLTITTHDGRVIIVEGYFSDAANQGLNAASLLSSHGSSSRAAISTNDGSGSSSSFLGISMPTASDRPPFPTTADYAFAPTTMSDTGQGWFQGSGFMAGSFISNSVGQGVNDHTELLDLSSLALTTTLPHWNVYGSFGDSYIRGLADRSNLIIDDYYQSQYLHVIGESVGNDIIEGGNASDYLLTHGGDDQVYGGGGTDIIIDRPEDWTEFGTVDWVNAPGHSNRDQLFGEAGNDLVSANAGDGLLSGGDGGDLLFGGAGSDTLLGGAGDDLLSGDTKNSSYLIDYDINSVTLNLQNLTGDLVNYGSDILDGGDGQDVLIGGGGADTLYGGEGNDVLMGDLVILNPQGTWTWENAPAGNAGSYSYATVLAQHQFDPDSIQGADVIFGDGGDDYIFGGGLADELHGGDGNDVIYGENQENGTAAEATIALAYQGADRIYGDLGNDTLYGNGGDDYIDGGDGDDVLVGDSNVNAAEIGNDELHGGAGADLIHGNGGDDTIYGDAGIDDLNGDAGDDTIFGGDGNDNIHGDSGNDTLEGGAGTDALGGDDGDDTLISSAGGDSLYGGAGNDTFVLRTGSGATYVNDESGTSIIRFDGSIRRSDVRVEAAMLAGSQSIRIFFGSTDYAFLTVQDFDRVSQFEFSDGTTLTRSELLLTYEPSAANLGDGKVHLNVDSASVSLHAVGSDLLIQYAGANQSWANTNDLSAKGVLWSESQAADFGLGSGEVLVLKNWYASDLGGSVSSIAGQSGDSIDLGLAALNLPRTQQATTATPYAVGNGGNDILLGSVGGDAMLGGAGDDTLDGGAGDDILGGGQGNDTYVIRQGSGVDIVSDEGGTDVIRFEDGIQSTDVAFHELPAGLEVVVGPPENENRLVVAGWFSNPESRVEQFVFEGENLTLSAAQVEARISGNRSPQVSQALSDSALVSEGAFNVSIASNFTDPNSADQISFSATTGAAFSPLPQWLSFDSTTGIFSGTAPAGSGSIDVTVYATDQDGLYANDTFTLTYAPALITGTPGNDDGSTAPILDGSVLGDRIEGLAGNDILRGNGGNDTLVGGPGSDLLVGGSGSDTYLFNLGDGSDTVDSTGATSSDVDVIKFGPGIQPGDVSYTRYGTNGLRIQVGGPSSSDSITIDQYFAPESVNLRVSNIQFQDAPAANITAAQIDSMVLVPTEQADYLRGTNSADSIAALGGNDTIYGLDGDDVLDGGAGNDSIDGGAGNDTLIGGGGVDTLTGGAGSDTYVLDRNSTSSTIFSAGSLSTDTDVLRLGTGITPADVSVERSGDALVLRIQPTTPYGSETVLALDGDGNNSLVGQSVDELRFTDQPGVVWTAADLRTKSLLGKSGNESIIGYDGDDVLRGGGGNDRLKGGLGNDTYRFGLGDATDTILDSDGTSKIVLDAGITPSNVTLYRSSSLDLSATPAGGDALVIAINGGSDQIWVESFYAASGPTAISQLVFGNGVVWDDATIRANVTNLAGTANALSGTIGDDNYVVDHPGDSISESSGGGTDTVTSSVGYALPNNVENLTLTGSLNLYGRGNSQANVITGNSGINYLYGNAGNDSLNGGAGNDTLDGGTGDDTLTGGTGDDYYVVETTSQGTTWSTAGLQNVRDVVVEAAGEGTDTIYADHVYSLTMANNVENLIVNSIASYSVTFNTTDDVRRKFIGNALDNVIDARLAANVGMGVGTTFINNGAGGEIVLDGGAGADTMIGANLRTRFVVDNVNDIVIAGSSSQDTVETSLAYTLGAGVENLTLTGTNAVSGTGSAVANILDGSKNTAANVLTGGAGDDTYVLGAGDTAVESAGQGVDTVKLTSVTATTYSLSSFANIENLSIAGTTANASLTGDVNANTLTANTGANNLVGGGGDDTLNGDAGNDIYDGFSLTSGNDTVVDVSGSDTIRFDSASNTSVSQLDFTRQSNDLLISVGAQSSIRVANWYGTGTNQIESLQVWDQGLLYNYLGSELQSSANGTNVGPRQNGTDSTTAGIGQAFSYQFRNNFFLDLDSQNSLAYTAKLSDGSALPSWLAFDSVTRTFSGTPTGNATNLSLQITATDAGGLTATNSLSIDVQVLPIMGTEGDDTLNGTSGYDDIRGLGGNDTLMGYGDNDSLDGGAGNDILDGGTGGDDMSGGTGNDIIYVDNASDTPWELPGEGTDEVRSSITYTLPTDIENLTLIGTNAIDGTGNTVANVIVGNSANNTLTGLNGDDTLDGGAGADTLIGGAGNDTYIVDNPNDVVTEASGQGTDTIRSSVTLNTLALNVENVTLIGTANIDTVGGSGNNVLTGNSGNNRLDGKAGTDTLVGGLGDDTYVVDSTTDTITELAGQGNDTVESSVTFSINTTALQNVIENITLVGTTANTTATGNALNNVLTGTSVANTLTGNDGDDTLYGLGGVDVLNGGNGNDILDGGAGNDSMTGGAGDDTYVVDSTSDTVTEASGGGTDTIQTTVTLSTWASNVENMMLLGTGNLNAPTTTSSANNVITGNSGNNVIDGGSGDDTLTGGGGNDTLTGGLGADTYRYSNGDGVDTINNVAGDSLVDRLQFTNMTSSQVSFAHVSTNLVITAPGGGSITVSNWFSATANRIDFLNFTNGEYTAAQVDSAANGGGILNGFARPIAAATTVTGSRIRTDFSSAALQNGPAEETVTLAVLDSSQSAVGMEKSGKKSGDPTRVHWEPIKSFLTPTVQTLGDVLAEGDEPLFNSRPGSSVSASAADLGVSRLAEAMAMFGLDSNVTNDFSSAGGQTDGLEQLAAQRTLAHGREFAVHHTAIN